MIDRSDVEQWDRDYLIHVEHTAAEYHPAQVVAADGAWLEFADGRRMLDFHGQYMCVGVGHGDPRLRAALHEAIDKLDYVCEAFTHEAKARAAKLLIRDTMDGSDWAGAAKFTASGSEAVECALLMARLYTDRPLVVTRQGAYHGWTAGAAAVTSIAHMRNPLIDPATGEVRHDRSLIPAPFAPIALSDELDGDGRLRCVADTELLIRSLGVENVAAVITELYHGAGGFLVPDGYPQQIRELADRLGILWIDDEVIAGAGRTGRWWAFQHYGVEPDIMCTGKGLSSSAAPAAACVVSRKVADFYATRRWAATSTFSGHPLAVAAIAANIELILADNVLEHVRDVGGHLAAQLADLAARHPSVAGASGIGLGYGINLVHPASGQPWVPQDRWITASVDGEPAFNPGAYVADRCAERGILLLNFLPNTVTIAPPLKISKADIDIAITAFDEIFAELDAMH
jgi:taurine--2-oxoglutarate transaminase